MSSVIFFSLSLMVGFLLATLIFYFATRMFGINVRAKAEKEAEQIVKQAQIKANRMEQSAEHKAKDMEHKMRRRADTEARKERSRWEDLKFKAEKHKKSLELNLKTKEENLEQQLRSLEDQKIRFELEEKKLKDSQVQAQKRTEELDSQIEKIGSLTREQAKEEIKKHVLEEVKKETAQKLMQMDADLKSEAKRKSRLILSRALSRLASEVVTERTVVSLPIKGDDVKGKIIGREGRNIRALESSCGVDIMIDETEERISISCFDPVRREVALQSLKVLIEEGRVHPARIEEVVEQVQRGIFNAMVEDAKKVCFDFGIHNVRPIIMETLGSLKFRYVGGWNVLKSCVEVARLAGFIAGELNFNEKIAKRAALFTALGLAVDHRVEGSYSKAGAELAKKGGESEIICQAIRCHNGEVEATSVLDHIVQVSYNLFRERPTGTKPEQMDNYINRLKDMESLANSFDGVIRSYALRSGKEIRVLVDISKVRDEEAFMLGKDIASKITKEHPESGHLIVSVVRESRMVEQAK